MFLDLCAWQHSTEEIETSDLAFNGGEVGAVHLKQRPLQCHSFVNMACFSKMAASLTAPCADGYPAARRCLDDALSLHVSRTWINLLLKSLFVFLGAVAGSCHHLTCSTQGSCCPAGDADRAAETGSEAHQPVFNWNPYGRFNTLSIVALRRTFYNKSVEL